MAVVTAFTLTAGLNNCTFPDYGFSGPPPAGSGGSGTGGASTAGAGSGGTAGGGGTAGTDIGEAGAAGNGGNAGDGSAGDAGSAGAGGQPCVFPVPVKYQAHCFDKTLGDGESGVDCGGGSCAPCSGSQTCTQASDCLSQQCASNKTCVPLIALTYTPLDIGQTTLKPKFRLEISYLDGAKSMLLSDFRIRYYYDHKNVTEPIIGLDAQTTIDQMDISNVMQTSVHRFPPGPMDAKGSSTDSYLEISYNDPRTVISGTKFVITQDLVPGSNDHLFDQNGHYSFSAVTGANTFVTVYRGAQRIWGVEPPMMLFPECAFSQGVNVNGAALTVSGEPLLAESDANFTLSGAMTYSNTNLVVPAVDKPTTTLLGRGRTLTGNDSITWPVPNGKYWAYAWLTSTVTMDNGALTFNTQTADRFFGKQTSNGPTTTAEWGLIGPYLVDVTTNSLQLTVAGTVHLAGLKLYEAP